jgi:hypothetical protein
MTTIVKLDDNKTPVHFAAGRYDIYITGGQSVEADSLWVKIVHTASNEVIPVAEHGLKQREFRAVRYFYFDIPQSGEYEVSVHNYKNVVVRRSMLRIFRLFQSGVRLEDVRIRIERVENHY